MEKKKKVRVLLYQSGVNRGERQPFSDEGKKIDFAEGRLMGKGRGLPSSEGYGKGGGGTERPARSVNPLLPKEIPPLLKI